MVLTLQNQTGTKDKTNIMQTADPKWMIEPGGICSLLMRSKKG